ncbi:hypothetical protein QZH46_04075 [Pseudomonas corrugata]|uniref:hypothetical protein n=1 Tax=Pseudomonas corrugata TaxID=47879 RepID=UPI00223486D5|nr:hypothetical protein [Pseudomonas corrugata]UZE04226.1 hypothetical protein LOY65_16085 [Pseudomonas corrugata]
MRVPLLAAADPLSSERPKLVAPVPSITEFENDRVLKAEACAPPLTPVKLLSVAVTVEPAGLPTCTSRTANKPNWSLLMLLPLIVAVLFKSSNPARALPPLTVVLTRLIVEPLRAEMAWVVAPVAFNVDSEVRISSVSAPLTFNVASWESCHCSTASPLLTV